MTLSPPKPQVRNSQACFVPPQWFFGMEQLGNHMMLIPFRSTGAGGWCSGEERGAFVMFVHCNNTLMIAIIWIPPMPHFAMALWERWIAQISDLAHSLCQGVFSVFSGGKGADNGKKQHNFLLWKKTGKKKTQKETMRAPKKTKSPAAVV